MGKIEVNNIRIFASHGCLREESIIGSDYRVDLSISANLQIAAASDKLQDTVDYVHLHRIIKEEMQIPSKLLEHVSKRIVDRIFRELPAVNEARLSIAKINPPIGGDVEEVKVILEEKRD